MSGVFLAKNFRALCKVVFRKMIMQCRFVRVFSIIRFLVNSWVAPYMPI